jgi:hypothetical protein
LTENRYACFEDRMLRTSFHGRNKLKLEKGSLILQSIRKVYTKGHYESVRRFLLNFKQEVEYPSPTEGAVLFELL